LPDADPESGMIIRKQSSFGITDYGNQTQKELERMRERLRQRNIYGEYKKDKGEYEQDRHGNWYYGMKLPEGISAIDNDRKTMQQAIDHAKSLVDGAGGARQRLESSSLPEDKKREIAGRLDSALKGLLTVNSADQIDHIIRNINSIGREIP
jgi:hypothetical protein